MVMQVTVSFYYDIIVGFPLLLSVYISAGGQISIRGRGVDTLAAVSPEVSVRNSILVQEILVI
jgi:hypothetical protein